MTDTSPRLGFPLLLPGQAQKHVTLNAALMRLDLLAHLAVRSRAVSAQPAAPAPGDCYILPTAASGAAWGAAPEGAIAAFADGAWSFVLPRRGWVAFVEDEAALVTYDRDGAMTGWSRAAAPGEAARNLLMNARFLVNQRGFGGGSLPAGSYGYDRWKAGDAGCSLTFAGERVTLTAGALAQIVELPGIAGRVVSVSVEDPDAPVGVVISAHGGGTGSVSGTIPAGPGRQRVVLTVPETAPANLQISFSGAAAWARPQVSCGAEEGAFEARAFAEDVALCLRYYRTNTIGGPTNNDATFSSGAVASMIYQFVPPMRAAPAISFTDMAGTPNCFSDLYGGSNGYVVTGGGVGLAATAEGFVIDFGASAALTNRWRIRYTADAEL